MVFEFPVRLRYQSYLLLSKSASLSQCHIIVSRSCCFSCCYSHCISCETCQNMFSLFQTSSQELICVFLSSLQDQCSCSRSLTMSGVQLTSTVYTRFSLTSYWLSFSFAEHTCLAPTVGRKHTRHRHWHYFWKSLWCVLYEQWSVTVSSTHWLPCKKVAGIFSHHIRYLSGIVQDDVSIYLPLWRTQQYSKPHTAVST